MRLDRLRALRARHDNRGLLFNLNEGIHGNMGGMGSAALYEKAKFGTKQLIVDYVDEIVSALEHLASPDVDEISSEEKLDFFHRADHCFGRSAFMMSGSGSLLYFHIGVVRTLLEQGLLPDVLSGSSGGSFVGSLVAAQSDADLVDKLSVGNLIEELETAIGYSKRSPRYKPSVMPIDDVYRIVERIVPDLTFQEALERTGAIRTRDLADARRQVTAYLQQTLPPWGLISPRINFRSVVLPLPFEPITP